MAIRCELPMKRVFLTLLLSLAVLVLVGWQRLDGALHNPLPLPAEGAYIEVVAGDSLKAVLARTAAAGWLPYRRLVEVAARWQGLDARIHVGEYHLDADTTAAKLLLKLTSGDVIRYQVTLPEGIRLIDALDVLGNAPALKRVLSGVDDPQLLALAAPYTHAEGLFLPETYQYTKGDTDLTILRRAHDALGAALNQQWQARDASVPLKTPYEALILASIVERESGVPGERPRIAGVFVRRLQQGMRLQTDPTVIYGLGARYAGNLTRAHLRDVNNPWNTYKINGLPPSPIALPGIAAISAVMHPAREDALYFVAKGDGSHAFATTLAEHEANVRRYQLRRAANYRSTIE